MAGPSHGSASVGPDKPLPQGIRPLRDIFDEKAQLDSFVSVIGVVYDARQPMKTRLGGRLAPSRVQTARRAANTCAADDYKAAVTLHDLSTAEYYPVEVAMFRSQKGMPFFERGDVVLIRSGKVP